MKPRVAVLDHGMGNLRSVGRALEEAGAEVTLASETSSILRAQALCVPGQGIFGRCMSALSRDGLERTVSDWITDERPYLGICLGMQILFESSEESGGTKGLGLVKGEVRRLPATVRVPHIGWNSVTGPSVTTHFYFDHSYAVHAADPSVVTGWCEHGERFAARVEAGSILGVQFHPEKSGGSGISLLEGWVDTI